MLRRLVFAALLSGPHASPADDGPGAAADPAAIEGRNGDTGVYAFATGPGVRILHSTNLVEWAGAGRVFEGAMPGWAGDAVPGSRGVWTPDVSFHDGLYHLYYSVSTFGRQRSVIGLAVNRRLEPGHPDNRWIDRGLVVESNPGRNDFNAIDPALFVDDDGQWILFFGSFWTGIKAVVLDPGTGKPPPGPLTTFPIARRAPGVPHDPIEAAFVVKRKGWYHLFVSWDQCCNGARSDYRVAVGRSREVLGPYVDQAGVALLDGGGTPILEGDDTWAGPGHNGVLQTGGRDYLVHHAFMRARPELGRLFLIRPLDWSRDGWPSCGEPLNQRGPARPQSHVPPLNRPVARNASTASCTARRFISQVCE